MDDLFRISGLTSLTHIIQLALAPVFLLTGIASLLNMLVGRLSRIVDRARRIEADFTPADHPAHARQVADLRMIDRRIALVNNSIFLCTASAMTVCVLVAGLFTARLLGLGFARTMAIIFIAAMLLLIVGLLLFMIEVRIAVAAIRVRDELLERKR
jgi:hypothetical protein